MRAIVQRAWLGRGPLAVLLLPLSLLYGLVTGVHRLLHASGLLRTESAGVPVVVVGNVVAGGAGKTPVVIALIRHLAARGLRAGVISRGFGRSSTACMEVAYDSSPAEVGDEPLLIRAYCDVPVFVGPTRAAAARALLRSYPDVQVLVSDDGLQHHGLARDIEICVFDARGIGNGWLLPAGPLREAWPRRVDFVLRPDALTAIDGDGISRRLATEAVASDGTLHPVHGLQGAVHAVAGIANPEAFFRMLREEQVPLARTTALPDHYDFRSLATDPDETVVCTEKDALKLWALRPDALAVPLVVEIAPSFFERFDRILDAKLSLSSRHGSETAGTAGLPGDEGAARL